MKRTPLRTHRVERAYEEGRAEWKTAVYGRCAACERPGLLLHHHVVSEQLVRREGGDPYDLRNAMSLGYFACACHREHHHAVRRLPASCLSAANLAFMVELLGEDRTALYIARHYAVA